LVLLFGIGLSWAIWKVIKAYREHTTEQPQVKSFTVLLIAILALDLPMMISYNYQLRYFLTLMPFLAILTAFFIKYIYNKARKTNNKAYPIAVSVTVSAIILYSLARIISLMLLVMHDARVPASAFMDTLPAGSSLERVTRTNHFRKARSSNTTSAKKASTNARQIISLWTVSLRENSTTSISVKRCPSNVHSSNNWKQAHHLTTNY
jgi:hypothetical protein